MLLVELSSCDVIWFWFTLDCYLSNSTFADMATENSQNCCEKLVAAGAVDTLLKLIGSVSRSMPDQEVLKHALSTLRNLARYPHLIDVLIDSQGSVQTIMWELVRCGLRTLHQFDWIQESGKSIISNSLSLIPFFNNLHQE